MVQVATALDGVTTHLSGCFTSLTVAQNTIAEAIAQAEEIHDTATALGAEETADGIGKVIDALQALDQALGRARATTSTVSAQVLHIAQGNSPGRPAAGGTVSPSDREEPSDLTFPSGTLDPSAVPDGATETNPRASRPTLDGLQGQENAAKVLAERGYQVRRLPQNQTAGGKNPDFDVEGRIFDCYTPDTRTPLRSMRSRMRNKAKKGQAERFVVNLDRSGYSAEDLRDFLNQHPSSSVREVLVVKDGDVSRVWPGSGQEVQ